MDEDRGEVEETGLAREETGLAREEMGLAREEMGRRKDNTNIKGFEL